ncbi:unnamed protein product [Darwinula stevensoni]|uniref:Importin N-terminal domain-containing protein n=1 Tax=Darwinula stevensoni TaxID=69355 RepID=A0A7R9A9E3_9CRUS|nr:unnamed protein product [Darwinula stevensoni]CAG0897126.1 unnamed protein product [Darwinula stevensoni]
MLTIHKIVGFCPQLLQIIMTEEVQMPVRQAAAIYLKNEVQQYWQERETEPGAPAPFSIHEQDRTLLRDAIVDATAHAPEKLRLQLAVCVNQIVKHDLLEKWPNVIQKVGIYLQNPDTSLWFGALLCLYQVVKVYEFKNVENRKALHEAMRVLLPMLYERCVLLVPDHSDKSVLLVKQILKIYFSFTQYFLPTDVISKDMFTRWMDLLKMVLEQPVPQETLSVDEDERAQLPWWKSKKWATHILCRMFDRYGSPGNVNKDYDEFANWYLKSFSSGIIGVLLGICDMYRKKVYIAPRVLQQCLNYLNEAVRHAFSWKFLKPHMDWVVQEVIFPLMCYSDTDAELWESDPHEYIRLKFDVFEDFVSPVTAAQTILHSVVKKRKDVLQRTMGFLMQIVTSQQADPRQKDGAFHMVGSLADILLKKQLYKDQMETVLVTYLFPEFKSPQGFLRARACWTLHYFAEIAFKNPNNLAMAIQMTVEGLLTDKELPVRVEAAIGLQMLLTSQEEKVVPYISPKIREITFEVLKIIRETENEDLTNVLQRIVCTYHEQLAPVAVDIMQHLVETFKNILESADDDNKAISAMGLLNTMDTMMAAFDEEPAVRAQLEPVAIQIIVHILQNAIMELYEETFSLVYTMTCHSITPHMWNVLEIVYQAFQKDAFDYFNEIMPALHNYVTVDTPAFLSNQAHVLAMFNMSKAVMTSDVGEDTECHAAKLLEVIILQCKGHIDQCIPSFVEVVLHRLLREVKTSELRTMCLQVVIAALYYNPQLLLDTLNKMTLPNTNEPIMAHFVKQWIHDTDCFLGLHNRKLCILGLCTLISQVEGRPAVINECATQIIPSLILLFDGLKKAYEAKAQEETEGSSDEEEEDEEDIENALLASDEDEVDYDSAKYLEALQDRIKKNAPHSPFGITTSIGEDDDDDDSDFLPSDEESLETFTTPLDIDDCPIDEYLVFKDVLQSHVIKGRQFLVP